MYYAGRIAERSGNLQQAANLWERIGIEYSTSDQAYEGLFQAGIVYYRMGEFDNAVAQFSSALGVSGSTGEQAGAQFWIGKCYDKLGELDKSKEHYERSINIFEKINRNEEIPHLLLHIAHLHQLKGEYDSSLRILQEYYELSNQLQEEENLASAHFWIGRIYAAKGELEDALENYQNAM